MRDSWIAFITFVYIMCTFMGSTFEAHTGADWAGVSEQSTLEYLTNMNNVTKQQDVIGPISFLTPNGEYFKTIFRVAFLNFEFLQEPGYNMVYWILFFPLALIGVFGMLNFLYQVIQGFLPW